MFIILLFAVVFTTQANENLWNLSFKDLFTEYIKTHFETMSPLPNAGKQVREVINLELSIAISRKTLQWLKNINRHGAQVKLLFANTDDTTLQTITDRL
nr:unnamed protein product [Fasciola hepatica]